VENGEVIGGMGVVGWIFCAVLTLRLSVFAWRAAPAQDDGGLVRREERWFERFTSHPSQRREGWGTRAFWGWSRVGHPSKKKPADGWPKEK
jgi:hypothetical protein